MGGGAAVEEEEAPDLNLSTQSKRRRDTRDASTNHRGQCGTDCRLFALLYRKYKLTTELNFRLLYESMNNKINFAHIWEEVEGDAEELLPPTRNRLEQTPDGIALNRGGGELFLEVGRENGLFTGATE